MLRLYRSTPQSQEASSVCLGIPLPCSQRPTTPAHVQPSLESHSINDILAVTRTVIGSTYPGLYCDACATAQCRCVSVPRNSNMAKQGTEYTSSSKSVLCHKGPLHQRLVSGNLKPIIFNISARHAMCMKKTTRMGVIVYYGTLSTVSSNRSPHFSSSLPIKPSLFVSTVPPTLSYWNHRFLISGSTIPYVVPVLDPCCTSVYREHSSFTDHMTGPWRPR